MRRQRRRERSASLLSDRRTLSLALLALGSTGVTVLMEVARVWRRGSAPPLVEAEDPLGAAAEAVVETAEVARQGFREVSPREKATFNLLASFVTAFLLTRGVTTLLRRRSSVGPFRTLRLGRRHIHHFVPGIAVAFASGAASIVIHDENLEAWLAIPFGAGMGLTMDESALLLELDDVYWSEEGIVSVQITLIVTALLAALALGTRFLRRGERVVLDGGS